MALLTVGRFIEFMDHFTASMATGTVKVRLFTSSIPTPVAEGYCFICVLGRIYYDIPRAQTFCTNCGLLWNDEDLARSRHSRRFSSV